MATSKAMGTGRKAPTRATKRMPPMVAWAMSACTGRSSMTRAPRMAARIISGKATRKTYQKLFRKERMVETSASDHVSESRTSIGHMTEGADLLRREATTGAKTKTRKRTVASLSRAIEMGKSAKVMARTTTLSPGAANMAARTDSVLMPEAYRPRAMGATQLVQTAKGMPAAAPKKVFR